MSMQRNCRLGCETKNLLRGKHPSFAADEVDLKILNELKAKGWIYNFKHEGGTKYRAWGKK